MFRNLFTCKSIGSKDWLWQRITALIILFYLLTIGVLVVYSNYSQLNTVNFWNYYLLTNNIMQVFSFVTVIGICYHAWLGLWTVATDYIKCNVLRNAILGLIIVVNLLVIYWSLNLFIFKQTVLG